MNRRRPLLALTAVVLGCAALLPSAPAASAAPPSNDDISGATVLGPVPFHLEQDTTEATTSAEEAAFNAFCGAPAFEHAVWFTATAIADNNVVADVTASDYTAGILVFTGEPGNLTPLTCQPGIVSGPVTAGETIYLVVFGDGVSEATSGQPYSTPTWRHRGPRSTSRSTHAERWTRLASCTYPARCRARLTPPRGSCSTCPAPCSSGWAGGSSTGFSAPSSSRRVTASAALGLQTSSPRLASSPVGRRHRDLRLRLRHVHVRPRVCRSDHPAQSKRQVTTFLGRPITRSDARGRPTGRVA